MNLKQFKHWLYELDEQEICNSREKILAFITKTLEEEREEYRQKLRVVLIKYGKFDDDMTDALSDFIRSINQQDE